MSTVAFDGRAFGAFGESAFARVLWQRLNEPEMVIRMIVASELGHVALDGVAEPLEFEFSDELEEEPRARQLVGAMIRQVLAPRQWELESTGNRVRRGRLFKVAARYRRREQP